MGIFGELVERMTVRIPDRIIPVSDRVKRDLLSMGVKSERMVVVPNGVDLEKIDSFFAPVTYEGKWPEGFKPPAQNPFLWASFSEDKETMNGMMTCVGIILPEEIYEAAKLVREHKLEWVLTDTGEGDFIKDQRKFPMPKGGWSDNFTLWEVELIKLLNSCPLAR